MKKHPSIYRHLLFMALMAFVFLFACRKSVQVDSNVIPDAGPPMRKDVPSSITSPYPTTSLSVCSIFPSYGDSILYPHSGGSSDYIVIPVNNPGIGKYISWPEGLTIDPTTGAIDVTKSETGMRYDVGFIQTGSGDTCISAVVIAGSSYLDSVYVAQTGNSQAQPYYNASLSSPSPCGGNGCAFDLTGSAAAQKVIVDKNTGAIDVKKTLGEGSHGGAFGPFPFNGQTVTTTMVYRLNDASNNALQQITLQLVYYDSKSLIPHNLLLDFAQEYNNLVAGKVLSTSYNPRPPLVIIVRKL